MEPALDINKDIFEHPEHWDGTTKTDPLHQGRNKLLLGLVPPDVREIIDVGCGEGAFLEVAAAQGFVVQGMDRSQAAVRAARVPVVLGSVARLPFKDHSYDLVSCTEVLEHLDGGILAEAVREIARVSRKYILIGVPWREQRTNQLARCGSCGHVFHAWGHVRSFNSLKQIASLFPGWQVVATASYGSQRTVILPGLAWLRAHVLGRWTWERSTVCPVCRGNLPKERRKTLPMVQWLIEGLEWRMTKRVHPWWVMVVLHRNPGARIASPHIEFTSRGNG